MRSTNFSLRIIHFGVRTSVEKEMSAVSRVEQHSVEIHHLLSCHRFNRAHLFPNAVSFVFQILLIVNATFVPTWMGSKMPSFRGEGTEVPLSAG